MDMKKRRDLQLAYIADETIMEEQSRCRKILQILLCKLSLYDHRCGKSKNR